MKTDDLKQILQKMVRNEISSELKKMKSLIREEVQSEVSKAMGKVLVEMVKEIKNPSAKEQLSESVESIEEEILDVPVPKTNNSKLNSALEQTAKSYKPMPRQPGGSLVELMEGGFDKIGKHEVVAEGTPATKLDFLKQMVNESAAPAVESVLDVPSAALPAPLKNMFKKDFRAILEASKKKQGGYSPNVSMG